MNVCLCGCGEPVARRFKPGHDARYKSVLLKAARAGDQAAHQTLVDNGWDKTTKTNYRPQSDRPTPLVTVDDRLDLLNDMKAAAIRLKAVGRYGRSSGDRYLAISRINVRAILTLTDEQLATVGQDDLDAR